MTLPDYDPLFAPYIWAVYGLAGVTLLVMIVTTALRAGRAKKALAALKKTDQAGSDQ